MKHAHIGAISKKRVSAVILTITIMIVVTTCSPRAASRVPADFYMLMDVHDGDSDIAQNIDIRIHANGRVEYDIYSTGGVISYDEDDIVTYKKDQIVQDGKFKLSTAQLNTLWDAFNQNHFFELDNAYQMAMGNSYAFIMLEADGKKHKVDNIGVDVPEIRALVETVAAMMPDGVDLEYGEGYIP